MTITSRQYGHPSQFGYKDICPLWKAERWDPEALVKLYKRAGAEYLVALPRTTITSIVGIRNISPGTASTSVRSATSWERGRRSPAPMGCDSA